MNLDLHEFISFPAEITLELETDSIDVNVEGFSFRDLISVRLNIQKVGEEYLCQGYFNAPVEEECCRCLVLFEDELSGDLNFTIKVGEGESSDEDDADLICIKAGEHLVDISEVVRQALILSIPLKPLCDENCKGLCPSCGVNLNEETCDCKNEEPDDRWEGLKDLSG
jgi:uncharacterized protein